MPMIVNSSWSELPKQLEVPLQSEVPSPGDSLLLHPSESSEVPFQNVYKLGEKLNAGAFGVVYKAQHVENKEIGEFAVKVMKRRRRNRDYKEKFLYEASILRDVRDVPNVIKLIDVYVDAQEIFMVQTLAKGGDVFDRLIQRETYTEKNARELARTLLQTVQYLHSKKIVHRDLKPENLLLRDENDDTSILLCDFGCAKRLPDNDDEGLHTYCGTAAFNAPEILDGSEYREKVDMWSIGCIIFMLLGGYLPFGGNDEDHDVLFHRILMGQVVFDERYWDVVSPEAEQLILDLLTLDAKSRLSATEASESEWFLKACDDEPKESDLTKSRNGTLQCNCSTRDYTRTTRSFTATSTLWESNSAVDNLRLRMTSSQDKLRKSSNQVHNHVTTSNDPNIMKCNMILFMEKLEEFDEEFSSSDDSSDDSFDNDELFSDQIAPSDEKGANGNIGEYSSNKWYNNSMHVEEAKEIDFSHSGGDVDSSSHKNDSGAKRYYTLEQLQKMSVPGLDYNNREKYLSDKEFKNVFNATREEVLSWKAWKVMRCKRQNKLW